jgi:5-methylthioribose kinase
LAPFVGRLAPEFYHYDSEQFVLVMEKLEPHIILRRALISGVHYPKAATDVAEYVAQAAFHTSDLAAPFERKFADVALFAKNLALQRISLDLVFTDPYVEVWRNKVTAPLEAWASALCADIDVKTAVARLRLAYLTKAQSLIHGDLHSGSVMVTQDDTRVIDGEFSWFGPSGFDVGNFLAHYVMAWFAKGQQAGEPVDRAAYRERIEADIAAFWFTFEKRFLEIWDASEAAGDGLPPSHFHDAAGRARLKSLQYEYVADVFRDALGFLAVKIIRRIIGYAQIADFLVIADVARRAEAQAGALAFARSLLLRPEHARDIADVIAALARFEAAGLDPRPTRSW